jgi:predicted transposase YbfD/YdcC
MAPMLRELNDRFSLAGQVLTADALNTQDGFTEFARDEVGAHYVLTAKKNRKNRKNLHAYPERWDIKNQVHWVRNATLREDDCKVRARNRPRNLATLHNLITRLIRQSGLDGIAATIRETEYTKTCSPPSLALTWRCEQRK